MANQTKTWAQLQSGERSIKLIDNGDTSYVLGTSATGAGIGSVAVPFAKVINGTYPLKFVDSGSGYLIGTSNG